MSPADSTSGQTIPPPGASTASVPQRPPADDPGNDRLHSPPPLPPADGSLLIAATSPAGERAESDAWWKAALLPTAAGLIFFGMAAAKLLALSAVAALAAHVMLRRRLPAHRADATSRAALSGLLLALTLPATAPAAAATVGGAMAVLVERFQISRGGRCRWHPVIVARVVVQFIFLHSLSFSGGLAQAPVLLPTDLVFGDVCQATPPAEPSCQGWLSATPTHLTAQALLLKQPVQRLREAADGLGDGSDEPPVCVLIRDLLPPWEDLLFGAVPAASGASSAAAVSLAVLYLLHRGRIRWQLPFGVLAAAAICAWAAPLRAAADGAYQWLPGAVTADGQPLGLAYVLYHLAAGEILLVGILLAGESATAPRTGLGHLLYGLGIGAITIFMRLYGIVELDACWAVLLMNGLVPAIDRLIVPAWPAAATH